MDTKKKISRGLAVLAAVFAAPAFAIQLSFDFTGTVASRTLFDAPTGTSISDTSWIGQSFSAQMVIDTERFASPIISDFNGWRDLSTISDEGVPPSWTGSLTIGGNAIDVQPYARNYAYVDLNDTEGVQSCGPGCAFGIPDSLLVAGRSDFVTALGLTNSSLFQLNAYQTLDFANPDPANYNYINLDQPFSLDSLLTIDLPNLQFAYATSTFDCASMPGSCFFQTSDTTRFNVTSVTRTDLAAVSVPEPGVLGLLGAGLLAARLARRRKRVAA